VVPPWIGFETTLTREIPEFTKHAVRRMFDKMLPTYKRKVQSATLSHDAFDWALHAGGEAIISGVQETMQLSSHQLRATREIYRTRGNSSSPTVLIVLDELRALDNIKDHVVATSFGPGLAIEMAFLRRCRGRYDFSTTMEAPRIRGRVDVRKAPDVALRSERSDSSTSLTDGQKYGLADRISCHFRSCFGGLRFDSSLRPRLGNDGSRR
jgi:hypothetical protein